MKIQQLSQHKLENLKMQSQIPTAVHVLSTKCHSTISGYIQIKK